MIYKKSLILLHLVDYYGSYDIKHKSLTFEKILPPFLMCTKFGHFWRVKNESDIAKTTIWNGLVGLNAMIVKGFQNYVTS